MRFKAWIQNEIALGSDGVRDNEPTQTNQAAQQAAQILQQSPKFADKQVNWMGISGNPSMVQSNAYKDIVQGVKTNVPSGIANQTTPAHIAFNISQTSPVKGLKFPEPKIMMKKRMKKKMEKK